MGTDVVFGDGVSDGEEFSLKVRQLMFDSGLPVGSDVDEALRMGAPPLHMCDPARCCDVCTWHANPHVGCGDMKQPSPK